MFKELVRRFASADIVMKFIYTNVLVYIILVLIGVFSVLLNRPSLVATISSWLELPASLIVLVHRPWTLFTYMFMHGGLMHILWNMFALYLFGRIFLDFFSVRHFVGVYLLGGLFGALFFVLAYNLFPYFAAVVDVSHLVGASAAVLAVVTAAAVRSPEYRINMLFFGSVKLSTFAIVTVCISVLMLSGNNAGGNFAHIGGAIAGAIFAISLNKGHDVTKLINWACDKFTLLFEKAKNLFARRPKMEFKSTQGAAKHSADYDYNARRREKENTMNEILDKVKRSGYASLTDEEKKRLFDSSQK